MIEDIPILTFQEKNSLEGEITLTEDSSALKKKKILKSPGSDSFTAEFFKLFFLITVGCLCCYVVPVGSPSRGGDVTAYVLHKPTELAHSFLYCSCVYFCLYGPFNCISFYKFSRQLISNVSIGHESSLIFVDQRTKNPF